MRHFLLGKNVGYPTQTSEITKVADGAVGFFYNNNGELKLSITGKELTKESMLVLGRSVKQGGPITIPIFKHDFSYTKGNYEAAKTFECDVTIPAPAIDGDYSLIIVRKGMKFNERHKWTASYHFSANRGSLTAVDLALKLRDIINSNSESSGVSATTEAGKINIVANEAGIDYTVIGADHLTGLHTDIKIGMPAYGDSKHIIDLANKAAADAGFEYTYQEAAHYLYPNYPLDPTIQSMSANGGFVIFTLRFSEPRIVKTTDEVISQVVQIAFPNGAATITTFETICKELSGIVVVAPAG